MSEDYTADIEVTLDSIIVWWYPTKLQVVGEYKTKLWGI